MKSLVDYINESEQLNESKTADFLVTVADCIEDPENVTMEDAKRLVAAIKDVYSKDITEDEAFGTCEMIASQWPEMFKK